MNGATVYGRFREAALAHPGRPFLHVLQETADIYGIAAGDITYGAMVDSVEKRRADFSGRGYRAGQRVGLLLQNRPAFLENWLALNALGVSVVPINPDLRSNELEYIVGHSEMAAAVVLPERAGELAAAASAAGRTLAITVLGSAVEPLRAVPPVVGDAQEDAECALLYTSGTTGQPKGCVLTNTYFLYGGEWYRDVGGLISLRHEGERMLTPLPVFHMNAMAVSVMAMITVGGCLVMLDRFHPGSWWDSVRESRATCVHYLGVMPSMLMDAPVSAADRDHHVRFGFGAGVAKALHAPFEARFGFPLIEAWAMTETGSGGCIAASREPRKVGTNCFGCPSQEVQLRIVGEDGVDVAGDMPGELLVRRAGPDPAFGFFREYLKDPQATAEAWEGGWLHTGDIVSRDADGDLHFVDRRKNVIRRAGENIAAIEVESVLSRHPLVRQVAVGATPDRVRGDEVAALIVLQDVADKATAADDIARWALDRMAYYKVPGWIGFVTELPMTPTSKIQRVGLKAAIADAMTAGTFHDLRHLKTRQV